MTCDHCRQQLLPYLYDLLDADERAVMAEHLKSCPECQSALTTAQDQQGLLAEAVKEEHADIVFKAPVKSTPASSAATVVMQRPPRGGWFLNRWAAAAAILFVLFSAGSVTAWSIWRQQAHKLDDANQRLAKTRDDLTKSEDKLNQKKTKTQKEIRAIQDQIDSLFTDWKKEETKTRKVLDKEGAQLIIKGPQIARAGANNNYEIELRQDLPGNLAQPQVNNNFNKDQAKQDQGQHRNLPGVTAPMNVRVISQRTNKVVHEQQLNFKGNQSNFALPSDLPLKPGEDMWMQFQTPGADGKLITLTDNLKLGSPEYVTHLANDRSTYRPGDTVRFRSLTLERFSLKPAQEKFHLRYRIVGPNDVEIYNREFANTLVGLQNQPIKGPGGEELYCLGAGEFVLPAELIDGNYTLSVNEVNERFNEEKRTFAVERPQPPRFTKDVKFDRDSYRPGDLVKVSVRVNPAAGIPIGKRDKTFVMANVVVDGSTVASLNNVVDKDGRAMFEFALPDDIHKGVGTVTFERNDGGTQEKAVHAIPLVVRDLHVEFYPEGGDLIAGVANRVYFQARTPTNKPATFTGWILDDLGREIAQVQTVPADPAPEVVHGLGSFTFTPQLETRYRLHIETPKGIARTFALPVVKQTGVVLHLPQEVAENQIDVRLHNVGKPRHLLVGAYCRGRMVDTRFVKAGANEPVRVALRPMAGVAGVYRITVFEQTGPATAPEFQPLAERLVYRKSAENLDIVIAGNKDLYQPGEAVQLTVQAVNEKMVRTPALAMLAVVDQSALKRGDANTVGLPAHFLLTTEIRNPDDLENANFLLSNHPKATRSLDLLFGSQGWRRFAEQDPQKFQDKQPQVKQPIFLANTAMVTQFLETEQKEIDKVDQAFVAKAIDMQQKLADTQKDEDGPADLHQEIETHLNTMEQMDAAAAYAEQSLREIRVFFVQLGLGIALLVLLLIAFYLISVGLRRLSEAGANARPWFTAGLGLIGLLFVVSVIGTFVLNGHVFFDDVGRGGRNFGVKKMDRRLIKQRDDNERLIWNAGNAPAVVLAGDEPRLEVAKILKADADVADKKGDDKDKERKKGLAKDVKQMVQKEINVQQMAMPGLLERDADRQLRAQKDYQAILLKNLGRRVQLPAAKDPCVVREYAHQNKPVAEGGRADTTETICWQPVLVMPDGKAEVTFGLNGAGTRFQVLVHCNTFDGRLATQRIVLTIPAGRIDLTK